MRNNKSEFFFSHKAGPGAYNLPQLVGKFSMVADKKNQPAYSIGKQSKEKILILCKSQAEVSKGNSSPGVWKYDPEVLKLKPKPQIAMIGREKRFLHNKDKEFIIMSIPHFYDDIDRNGIKNSANKTNWFPKFSRFKERDIKLNESKNLPSSQSYNDCLYNTIGNKINKNENFSRNNHAYSRSIDRFEFKNYYKELERGYVNKNTPGPAAYSTQNMSYLSNFRKSFNSSFSKQERRIHELNELSPGPHSYNTVDAFDNLKQIVGAGTIGKSRKQIDVSLFNALYKSKSFQL